MILQCVNFIFCTLSCCPCYDFELIILLDGFEQGLYPCFSSQQSAFLEFNLSFYFLHFTNATYPYKSPICSCLLSPLVAFCLFFTLKLQLSSFFFLSSYLSCCTFIYVFPLFNLFWTCLSHSEGPKASVAVTAELW